MSDGFKECCLWCDHFELIYVNGRGVCNHPKINPDTTNSVAYDYWCRGFE